MDYAGGKVELFTNKHQKDATFYSIYTVVKKMLFFGLQNIYHFKGENSTYIVYYR